MVLTILIVLLGPAAGSFAALVAERSIRGEAIFFDRSRCVDCGVKLRAGDLVPIVSYLLKNARCSTCGTPIPPVLIQSEIVGLIMAIAAIASQPDPLRAGVMAIWLWSLLALAVADLRFFRLPDSLVLACAVAGMALALLGDTNDWAQLGARFYRLTAGAVVGGGAFMTLRVGYRLLRGREGMGLGDVKLMAAIGLALGAPALAWVGLLAALSTFILSGLRAVRKGRPLRRLGRVPFGAALALAAAATAVAGL